MTMKQIICNIWDLHSTHWIVIPTNIGWKSNGDNVMGAGLAKQAALKYPDLPKFYGDYCQEDMEASAVIAYPEFKLIMFPVKELNRNHPHLSWKQDASLPLIEKSAKELSIFPGNIAIPMVGCGAGNLKEEEVLPVLERYLSKDNFILVRQTA